MCKDPVHGAYKIKAVKWFIFGLFGLLTFTCPTCLSDRVRRLVTAPSL
jgi:hypothetical protein